METYKFEPYFTGEPLVRVEYSYNETTMFRNVNGAVKSAEITEEQLSQLNRLHPDQQIRAASIFAEAYGPEGTELLNDPLLDERTALSSGAN
jgi:hypothetical protein